MRKLSFGLTIFRISAVFILAFIAGCGQQNPPDTKMTRLIAAENMQLKKDLQQKEKELQLRDREVEKQIEQFKKDLQQKEEEMQLYEMKIEKQKELFAKCLEEKKVLEEKLQENTRTQVDEILSQVMEENTRLREENEKLKAQTKHPDQR